MNNNTSNLRVGDLAVLKSGGPVMTVNRVSRTYRAYECAWITGNGYIQKTWFDERTIREPKSEEKP